MLVEIFLTLAWKLTASSRSEKERSQIIKKVKGMYSVPKNNEDDPEVDVKAEDLTNGETPKSNPMDSFPVKSDDFGGHVHSNTSSLAVGELTPVDSSPHFFDSIDGFEELEIVPQDYHIHDKA